MVEPLAALLRGAVLARGAFGQNAAAMAVLLLVVVALYLFVLPASRHEE